MAIMNLEMFVGQRIKSKGRIEVITMFKPGSIRNSHYTQTPHGRIHDADIKRLEGGHKQHMDLGKTTEPDVQSHNPDQDNYEHVHTAVVSPTVGSESPALMGIKRGTA
jgi:hypothetical protein